MKFYITTTDEFFSNDFNRYKKYLEKYNLTEIETDYFTLTDRKFYKHYVELNSINELIDIINHINEQIVIYQDCNEYVIEIYNDYRE